MCLYSVLSGRAGAESVQCGLHPLAAPQRNLPMTTPEAIGRLVKSFRKGDQTAGQELAELLYPELRRLAAATMKRERGGHTLQPTALVHELYLELLRTKGLQDRDYGDHVPAA